MPTRFQEKLQQFGNKQTAKQKAADWMAGGPTEPAARTTHRKRPPVAPLKIERGGPTKKSRGAGEKVAVQSTAPPVVALPPVSVVVIHSPIAASPVTAAQVALPATPTTANRGCDGIDDVGREDDDELGESEPGSDDEVEIEATVQVVTPRRHTEHVAPIEDAVVNLSVEQYQAIIVDYQARLVRAERQLRAVSKTALADKFMDNEVRKYVKESLWKRCKFITCDETMEECMTEVACHFAINLEKRDHWKSTYAHSVRDALNNRRNNSAQDLKKEVTGKW